MYLSNIKSCSFRVHAMQLSWYEKKNFQQSKRFNFSPFRVVVKPFTCGRNLWKETSIICCAKDFKKKNNFWKRVVFQSVVEILIFLSIYIYISEQLSLLLCCLNECCFKTGILPGPWVILFCISCCVLRCSELLQVILISSMPLVLNLASS